MGVRILNLLQCHAVQFKGGKGTILNADEASSWDELHKRYEVKRINHEEAYSLDGACTNWAEEFFSRMRRAEIGHHIAGQYLLRYAQEASWREDNRRVDNGAQVSRLDAHTFDLLFHLVNVSADFGALGAEGGDNVRFSHTPKIGVGFSKFLWRLRHNTENSL
jgi:hypothetical protein